MRIDPKGPVTRTSLEPRTASGSVAPPATAPGASVVKLSAAGASIKESARPATTERLAQIRQLLDKGEYPVDLDALAARIVEDDVLRTAPRS